LWSCTCRNNATCTTCSRTCRSLSYSGVSLGFCKFSHNFFYNHFCISAKHSSIYLC